MGALSLTKGVTSSIQGTLTSGLSSMGALGFPLEKAMIIPMGEGGKMGRPIPCLFNPAEYSLNKGNSFAEIAVPGLDSPIIQFVRGQARTLNMDLFFDTYEWGLDVRQFTLQVTNLMAVDSDLHAPPLVMFVWGLLIFKAIVESVNTKFTMFNGIGLPVRATCNITFKEFKSLKDQLNEKPRFSADVTKIRTVIEGDALWSIAAREYGQPDHWRLIAEANGIEDPRRLIPGQKLRIPPLEP